MMRWHLPCLTFLLSTFFICVSSTQAMEGITVVKKNLDGPLEDIQWADLQTVFVITERGTVYKSKDGGKQWMNIVEQFHSPECEGVKIQKMHISTVDPNHIIFTGLHKCNFITTDMAKTISYTPLDIKDVRLHPTQKDWVLASSMSNGCDQHGQPTSKRKHCYKTLHYSKNFGSTWTEILTYVVQFDWSPPVGNPKEDHTRISDDLIYVTAHSIKTGNQKFGFWDKNIHFITSYDYFKTETIVVPNGNRFLFGEHALLFVAAVSPHDTTQVTLKVSRDNVTRLDFKSAQLPVELTEHSYTILDTSEGSVFLHVNHKPFAETAYAGHVYVSDWSGTRYSLSLPYNHRSADGKCDFEKVEGLEGIYLANFIDEDMIDEEEATEQTSSSQHGHGRNHADIGKDRASRLKTKTVITFDKGGEWNYLTPPHVDSQGHEIKCSGECHLHLHGVTDLYGPFYSAATAVGLIMATGSVGTHLQANQDGINTYLSRDAGKTWFEVAKGSHIYEFGDHGGIIVMAEDSVKTTKVYYSWDEGLTWTPLEISKVPMQIENIIIEPEAVSQQFLIYGWEGEQGDVGVIIYLPFDELHETPCTGYNSPDTAESDYETWTPSDGRLNGKCLLGHTTNYVRRKRDRQCYNPEVFERPIIKENCPCTDEDFQCDYGYERQGKLDSAECIEIPSIQSELAQHDQCATSNTYRISKGYRRVPGDTCTGGEKWEATELPCPSPWLSGGHIGKIILILLILVIISLALVTAATKFEAVDDFLTSLRGRFSQVRYKLLGTDTKPESMVDEDAFYLSEDEFGPSANLIDSDTAGRRPSKQRDHDGLSQRGSVNTSSTSNIRPLPVRSAAAEKVTKRVPALAPSPDDDFNPRGS